jgi:DNA-binding MarR family transcriptional regulator
MLARETVELLIQAARVAHASRALSDVGPAEWMALRFFARANVHSRKPSALADFEAGSRAAVSNVIGRLERGGYLVRKPSSDDGRSYSVEVTPKGTAALRNDPITSLIQAVRDLPAENREALHRSLRDVLTGLAGAGARRQFDTCRDCAHLIGAPAGDSAEVSDRILECGLFQVAIDHEAANQLCAHFQPAGAPSEPRTAWFPKR